MKWKVEFLKEAEKDLEKLDKSMRIQVLKGINKVSTNPLPKDEGGYGKPLGNRRNRNLTNLMKIKFLNIGVRVVYKLERSDETIKVIIISVRTDEQVYQEAANRRRKNNL